MTFEEVFTIGVCVGVCISGWIICGITLLFCKEG